jgi:hypothetical protein
MMSLGRSSSAQRPSLEDSVSCGYGSIRYQSFYYQRAHSKPLVIRAKLSPSRSSQTRVGTIVVALSPGRRPGWLVIDRLMIRFGR